MKPEPVYLKAGDEVVAGIDGLASSGSAWWRIASSGTCIPRARPQVVEPNQKYLVARAMLCDSQQLIATLSNPDSRAKSHVTSLSVIGSIESTTTCPSSSGVAAANLHMAPLPDPHGAPDPAAPNFSRRCLVNYHGWTLARSALGTAARAA